MQGNGLSKAGLLGSILALFTAACCVLPLALMLVGLGGSWVAVLGSIAAAGYYVGAASTALIALAWFVAIRSHAKPGVYGKLAAGTVIMLVAWLVLMNEGLINNYLIGLM
ncbi:hypothetical protein [Hoeflea poritis]|uniref:Mercuric transport protein MerT n=1 Tax=Hoeflea poritis TaxID=2993659 RepID=A0ABT4VHL3_9HYPH|nr:hypothetical protein [Hoeflea poritis]MDA4844172.1 hypothetical protein [Hoeflea poritis]